MRDVERVARALERAAKKRFPKHSFKARVEIKMLVDGRYVTRVSFHPEVLALTSDVGFGCMVAEFLDQDIECLEKGARKGR